MLRESGRGVGRKARGGRRKRGVQRVVCFSTSEVYGTARFVPMTEAQPWITPAYTPRERVEAPRTTPAFAAAPSGSALPHVENFEIIPRAPKDDPWSWELWNCYRLMTAL